MGRSSQGRKVLQQSVQSWGQSAFFLNVTPVQNPTIYFTFPWVKAQVLTLMSPVCLCPTRRHRGSTSSSGSSLEPCSSSRGVRAPGQRWWLGVCPGRSAAFSETLGWRLPRRSPFSIALQGHSEDEPQQSIFCRKLWRQSIYGQKKKKKDFAVKYFKVSHHRTKTIFMVFHEGINCEGLVIVKYKQVDICWLGWDWNVPNSANMSLCLSWICLKCNSILDLRVQN